MIKSMQRCQNCRFFKRTWEKVEKRGLVTYYIDRRELTPDEINSIAGKIEYEDRVFDREGMIILPEKLYERIHAVRWHEYVPLNKGVCRRYPPHPYHSSPRVDENHYCGEWRSILVSMNISAYTEE